MTRISIWNLTLLSLLVLTLSDCQKPSTEPLEEGIFGRAFLKGFTEKEGIEIVNATSGDTTYTDRNGYYKLPLPAHTGTDTIRARRPYFSRPCVAVAIDERHKYIEVPDLTLTQQLRIELSTDTTVYRLQELMTVSVRLVNVGSEPVFVYGNFYPGEVVCVAKNDWNRRYRSAFNVPNAWMEYWGMVELQPQRDTVYTRLVGRVGEFGGGTIQADLYDVYVEWSLMQPVFPIDSLAMVPAEIAIIE